MRIPKHNWETQQLDYTEYPDALFEPFLVWLLTTNAWREDLRRVSDKVLVLQRTLAEYRTPADTHREAESWGQVVQAVVQAVASPSPAEALAATRRANLAKARASKKAKKELQHA